MSKRKPTEPWQAPDRWPVAGSWRRIATIDAHAAGEPFRVVVAGAPEVEGETMLARRRWAEENLDDLRRALIFEPRGHADMYGCLLTPPATPGADLGVLFMHNAGWSTMCGHGVIALTTVAVTAGMVAASAPETVLRIDSPAGPVTARAQVELGDGEDSSAVEAPRVHGVRFRNVPSYAAELDATIEVPGFGAVRYDLAFGGAFYAYVAAGALGLGLAPEDAPALIAAGRAIKRAIVAERAIEHPFERDLGFLYGVIFVGPPADPAHHSRNVCIFADGELDRSPTGSGVSGRLAIHHARGEVAIDQRIAVESILGTCFTGRILATATCGPHDAIIPEIAGAAFITGRHEFLIDPDDPLREGFLVR